MLLGLWPRLFVWQRSTVTSLWNQVPNLPLGHSWKCILWFFLSVMLFSAQDSILEAGLVHGLAEFLWKREGNLFQKFLKICDCFFFFSVSFLKAHTGDQFITRNRSASFKPWLGEHWNNTLQVNVILGKVGPQNWDGREGFSRGGSQNGEQLSRKLFPVSLAHDMWLLLCKTNNEETREWWNLLSTLYCNTNKSRGLQSKEILWG